MKKKIFTLLSTASKMSNFISRFIGVKRSIKKCKQAWWRQYKQDMETSMLETILQAFIEEVLR